jgi:hypothetical protein
MCVQVHDRKDDFLIWYLSFLRHPMSSSYSTFEGSQSEADMKTIKSWSFRHLALHPTLPHTLIFTNISKLPLFYINYTLLYIARLCILS